MKSLLMKLPMFIIAKEFVPANHRFAARKMNAAMDTAHHIFADRSAWRLILLNVAVITFEDAIDNPNT